MRKPLDRAVLFALLFLSVSPLALAQTPAANGVETYPPSFFAEARPATAMDMIGRLPGFSFDGGDNSRGLSGNAGNVLIDGKRPSSKSDSLGTILSRIIAADVDHIEVIHGGAPGIDMQGRTIIANVIRKKVDSRTLVVVGSAFRLSDNHVLPGGRAEYSHRSGEQTYEASIRRDASFNDPITGSLDVTDAANVQTRTPIESRGEGENLTFNGAVRSPLAGGDFGVNLTLQKNYFNGGSLYDYPSAAQIFGNSSQGHSGEVGVNYRHDIGASTLDVILLQRLGHSIGSSTSAQLSQTARSSSLTDTGETIGRFALRYPFSDTLSVEGGGEVAYNFLRGESAFVQNGVAVPLPSSHVRVEETRGETFGQVSWKIFPDLTLDAGLRAEFSTISQSGDVNNSRSFFYLKPRALLSWVLDATSELRVRVEQKLGQLNFYDFISSTNLTNSTVSAGNPELQPDRRWQYEAIYEHRFWNKGAVTFTFLHQDIENLLDNLPVVSSGTIFDVRGNIGSGKADQLSASLTLPLDKLGIAGGLLSGSAYWRQSEVRDPVTGLTRRFAGEAPYNFSVNFSQDIPEWNATWGFYFSSAFNSYAYRYSEISHFTRFPSGGLNMSYTPEPDLRLSFSVDNIFGFRTENLREIYVGQRDISALSSRRNQISTGQPRLYFSVRKTFN